MPAQPAARPAPATARGSAKVAASRLIQSPLGLALPVLLAILGFGLWFAHARARDLGGRAPVMAYDAAQYALAAKELAEHGRLATTFALPIELASHARPPWPLAVVQPGLVVVEAAVEWLAPERVTIAGRTLFDFSAPERREWSVLAFPFMCFLALGLFSALLVVRILERHAPGLMRLEMLGAALTVGAMMMLDPEAQHFSTGGYTEPPYVLGIVLAFATLALRRGSQHPLMFGLLLGVTGAFRANMLWTAPLLAVAAAFTAEPPRRLRVAALTLLGFALLLAPWWFYKWHAFGDPSWDLSRFVVWDDVQGHSLFSLYHLPSLPDLPHGMAAVGPLAAKVMRNLPVLALGLTNGPRALWIGALLVWLLVAKPPRPLAAAGWMVLIHAALGLATAAISIPWKRYVFPSRLPLEVAGVMALWALMARFPMQALSAWGVRTLRVAVALLAIGWGVFQNERGLREAAADSLNRGVPSVLSLVQISRLVVRDVPREEPVMSNLGPTLAWYSRRPVIHLSLSPVDLDACRRHVDFRHVVLVYRDPASMWPEWQELISDPVRAPDHPEWDVRRVRVFDTWDGFKVVWLELRPLQPGLARSPAARDPGAPALAAR